MARRPQAAELVPAFESDFLSSIAIAMGKRRKAGDVGSFTPDAVVYAFEASLSCVHGLVDPAEATPRLLAVWKEAGPEIERDDNAR
jgi:hypothetical protein